MLMLLPLLFYFVRSQSCSCDDVREREIDGAVVSVLIFLNEI